MSPLKLKQFLKFSEFYSMVNEQPWYLIRDLEEIDTPALVVYPERVRQNIQTALKMAGGAERLRPHIKTNKSPEAVRMMMDAGIRKFKCATIAEAELLGRSGASDVLFAYQPLGPKLERLLSLIRKYPRTSYSCLVDHPAAALAMSKVFETGGIRVPVFLDLNLGMNRTGISPEEGALELYQLCAGLPGIRPIGLHAYDGHLRDPDWETRRQKCDAAFERVTRLGDLIGKSGFTPPVLVLGGSPTFSIHCKRENIECSPGTFIYWDKGYADLCPEQAFIPAALVLSRVISLPASNRICTDLGHKSVASENDLQKRVVFLNAPGLRPLGQSEEHLVLETDPGQALAPGDVLYGLPYHICPTVALYERALTIEEGLLSGQWSNLARDRRLEC
jgi:D-threonine aldolase